MSQEEVPTDNKNPHAVALGRMGGLVGGKARAKKLSKKRRIEIAREGAKKRWNQYKTFLINHQLTFRRKLLF